MVLIIAEMIWSEGVSYLKGVSYLYISNKPSGVFTEESNIFLRISNL